MSINPRFKYSSEFNIDLASEIYKNVKCDRFPDDIKRIWSTCNGAHMFTKRIYFFSPSQRNVYDIFGNNLFFRSRGGSDLYSLRDDIEKRYDFYLNDFIIEFTKDMIKIELPKRYHSCGVKR